MNEALPRWRTFGTPAVPPPTGSGAQAPASPVGERTAEGAARLPRRSSSVVLPAGAAAALLGVALLAPATSSDGGTALTGPDDARIGRRRQRPAAARSTTPGSRPWWQTPRPASSSWTSVAPSWSPACTSCPRVTGSRTPSQRPVATARAWTSRPRQGR